MILLRRSNEWKQWKENYEIYKAKECSVEKGKIAQFWVGFMKKDWLLMRFLRTTKENNLTFQFEKAK